MQNFIDVVRSRRTADLYSPIEGGHISSALCHLGNISHRLGATMNGELRETMNGSWALRDAYGRMVEHLHANDCDLAHTPLTLGMPLLIDAKAERFTGANAARANALLTREYRSGFTVPSIA
jgi:hypothetical protein